jgi:ribonuclease P protein component
MIAQLHRFHGYNSLRHVYSRGKSVRSSTVALKFIRNDRRKTYRAAVVVSRKVHKSAVVRNRIRRRLYEVIRQHEKQISQPYDLVFTVFSEQLATAGHGQLTRQITELLTKSGIIEPTGSVPRGHDIVVTKE